MSYARRQLQALVRPPAYMRQGSVPMLRTSSQAEEHKGRGRNVSEVHGPSPYASELVRTREKRSHNQHEGDPAAHNSQNDEECSQGGVARMPGCWRSRKSPSSSSVIVLQLLP